MCELVASFFFVDEKRMSDYPLFALHKDNCRVKGIRCFRGRPVWSSCILFSAEQSYLQEKSHCSVQ